MKTPVPDVEFESIDLKVALICCGFIFNTE